MAAFVGPEETVVKNPKGKAGAWNHFSLIIRKGETKTAENVAACNLCNAIVKCSGGTTNLTTHLRRHHPAVSSPSTYTLKKSDELAVQQQAYSTSKQVKQQTINNAFSSIKPFESVSEKAQRITSKIARFIVKDMRPYSMVESAKFREMLAECEPRYQVPSRKTFSEVVIPRMYAHVYEEVKSSLKRAELVALTTDGWSSRATESYITITSSHIDENWTMKSYVLQTRAMPESHTGEHVAAVLQGAVDEWNIPTDQTKPFNPPLVSDNASNMVKASQFFNSKIHVGCYAHTLNLAAQKCLKVKRVSHILARMRKIVAFFHKSNIATDMLKNKAEGLGLPQHKLIIDVCTRWNSAYDMISRFLEMQVAVFAVLRSKEVGRLKDTDMKSFSDDDLIASEEIIQLLKPLKDITTLLCTEQTPTASMIMPLHHQLTTLVFAQDENDSAVIKEMKGVLVNDLQDRYKEQANFLNMCTALDPRFKQLPYVNEENKITVFNNIIKEVARVSTVHSVVDRVKEETSDSDRDDCTFPNLPSLPTLPIDAPVELLDATISPIKKVKTEKSLKSDSTPVHVKTVLGDIFGDVYICGQDPPKTPHDVAESQVMLYRECPPIPLDSNPLKWWKENEYKGFPMVARLAKMLLCIPGTSVPSERVFSTAGDILNAQRANLKSKHVDRLIFLKKNMQ